MRIGIFGTGGVGGFFGGRLARAGFEVVFIARGEHLQAMLDQGLRVYSVDGDFKVYPLQATSDPVQAGIVDAVLLGVKAWQVHDAALAMQPMIGDTTIVLPLQNGVDAPDQLAEVIGKEHVLGGMCQISVSRTAPGVIRHHGIRPYIALGELDPPAASPRVLQLQGALRQAGVQAVVPDDIRVAMWRKFLFIATVSGVGALTRAPIGVLRSLPETRELLEGALKEIYAVGRAREINLSEETIEGVRTFIASLPPDVKASMQRDIVGGRPSELGEQNGAVVRMGAQLGIPTPVNGMIYSALLPQEKRARGEIDFE